MRRRLQQSTIGFGASESPPEYDASLLAQATTRDFIDNGFEPEFIGRLPVRVVCHPLSTDDLYEILKTSEGSIIRQYEQSFDAYGIEVIFKDDGLRRIAEMGAEEKTGARGLMTVCERIFRELKFELPSTNIRKFEVTQKLVDQPGEALARLIDSSSDQEQQVMLDLVAEFEKRFKEDHALTLKLTEPAAARLIELAQEQKISVREICSEKFKDFQFGLKLISQNTGQKEFLMEKAHMDNPGKILSDWVVASYREKETREDSNS